METKTFDEFIARQVQAVLAGEFVISTCFGGYDHQMSRNAGVHGPRDGMVWRYGFGRAPDDRYSSGHWHWVTENWYVNPTQRKVVDVVYK